MLQSRLSTLCGDPVRHHPELLVMGDPFYSCTVNMVSLATRNFGARGKWLVKDEETEFLIVFNFN